MAIPVEVIASKKIIYIDRDEYHPDDNPLSIDGNPFYFKDIESLDKYFNELLGSLLASKFDLKTVKYKLACIRLDDISLYGIISPSMFIPNKKYVMADSIIGNKKIPTGLENLDKIAAFFKNDKELERFILELLKMAVLDFYMNQIDRVKENFYIIKNPHSLSLAPLYDYSESFNSIYDEYGIDYTFNYPINRHSSTYVYGNAIMKLKFPSDDLYRLFNQFPLFKEYFKRILDIDMNELLNLIRKKYDLRAPKYLREHYMDYDHDKKEFVKNLI